MSIIVATTVLNIAHDRLSGSGIEALPPFLERMYQHSGKAGVTSVFVAAGLSLILVSFVLQRNRTQRSGLLPPSPTGAPYFYTPPAEDSSQEVTASGGMILQTRKYLPTSLSGTTGWPDSR